MSVEDLEQRRLRVRQGIWRTIAAIIAIDCLLLLRMCGAL